MTTLPGSPVGGATATLAGQPPASAPAGPAPAPVTPTPAVAAAPDSPGAEVVKASAPPPQPIARPAVDMDSEEALPTPAVAAGATADAAILSPSGVPEGAPPPALSDSAASPTKPLAVAKPTAGGKATATVTGPPGAATPAVATPQSPEAVTAIAAASGGQDKPAGGDPAPGQAAAAAGADAAPAAPAVAVASPSPPAAASTQAAAQVAAARVGASETVAGLAASVARRLDGRTSRFDVALNPLGLGRVDVRLEIGADGRTSAALVFDRPEAAAMVQAHSGELRQALAQSGLDLPPDALTFDVAGGGAGGFSPGAQSGGEERQPGAAARLGAFARSSAALDAAPVRYAAASARGVDIRI